PSRFDILYILRTNPLRIMFQSRIRKILGIAGSTLTRMVVALERLGFLRRRASDIDRRQVEISLTEHGRSLITHAMRTIVRSGIMHLAVVHFVCPEPQTPESTLCQLGELETTVRHIPHRLCY